MGAKSKRGPASVPAQTFYELKLTLKVEGFQDDCNSCCGLADKLRDLGGAGRLYGASGVLDELSDHIDAARHGRA